MRQGVRAAKQEQRLLHEGVQEQAERKPMKAKIKYHDGASNLERHGAMWDMAASETVTLRKGEVRIIPLGVSMKLPSGFMGVLVPRSSTCLKHGIMMANSVGIIENDYSGDGDVWGFVAYAIRDTVIEQGTRIAQFMPVRYAEDIEFEELPRMVRRVREGAERMSEIELKPCPFCGSEPEFHEASQISETWFVASVNCRSCCAQVVSQGMETKTAEMANESAIAAWNKRVIGRDELLKIADELENKFFVV